MFASAAILLPKHRLALTLVGTASSRALHRKRFPCGLFCLLGARSGSALEVALHLPGLLPRLYLSTQHGHCSFVIVDLGLSCVSSQVISRSLCAAVGLVLACCLLGPVSWLRRLLLLDPKFILANRGAPDIVLRRQRLYRDVDRAST